MMHFTKSPAVLLALALALILCAACSNEREPPPRDFNELIPRLLGAIENKTPEEAAVNLFNVTSPDERRDAIAYLETKPYGHDLPYLKAYRLLARDPHPLVRGQALRALGSSGLPAEASYLVKGLADPDPMVRCDAAYGLVATFDDSAVTPLAKCLREDPDDQVRIQAAMALHNASSQEAIRALIDAVGDRDAAVAYWAYDSLVRITSNDFGVDRRAWLVWYRQTYSPASQPVSQPASAPATRPG